MILYNINGTGKFSKPITQFMYMYNILYPLKITIQHILYKCIYLSTIGPVHLIAIVILGIVRSSDHDSSHTFVLEYSKWLGKGKIQFTCTWMDTTRIVIKA